MWRKVTFYKIQRNLGSELSGRAGWFVRWTENTDFIELCAIGGKQKIRWSVCREKLQSVVTRVHHPYLWAASQWSETWGLRLRFLPWSEFSGFCQRTLKNTLKHWTSIWCHQFAISLVLITGLCKKTMHQFASPPGLTPTFCFYTLNMLTK